MNAIDSSTTSVPARVRGARQRAKRSRVTSRNCSFALLLLTATSAIGAGCDSATSPGERGQTVQSRIWASTPVSNDAVFGFETMGAWSTTTTGATLAQSTTHSQGSYSLAVRPSNSNGYTPLASIPLSTLSTVGPILAVDVMLPKTQVNPWWYGAVQAYLNCPSRSIHSQFLGQVELTGKPLAAWNTVSFPVNTSYIAALLNAGYSDLVIAVALNVQVPTTATYYVDNLRFLPAAVNGCNGLPNRTSCTDGNACTVGDACQSNICKPGPAVTCVALDPCHAVGTCAPSTGICSNPVKTNGVSGDDGNGHVMCGSPPMCTMEDNAHCGPNCLDCAGVLGPGAQCSAHACTCAAAEIMCGSPPTCRMEDNAHCGPNCLDCAGVLGPGAQCSAHACTCAGGGQIMCGSPPMCTMEDNAHCGPNCLDCTVSDKTCQNGACI